MRPGCHRSYKLLYHLTIMPYHGNSLGVEFGLLDVIITEAAMLVAIYCT